MTAAVQELDPDHHAVLLLLNPDHTTRTRHFIIAEQDSQRLSELDRLFGDETYTASTQVERPARELLIAPPQEHAIGSFPSRTAAASAGRVDVVRGGVLAIGETAAGAHAREGSTSQPRGADRVAAIFRA